MRPRLVRLSAAVALQLVALVLAHEFVYLARYGSRYGEALVHAGHGQAWGAAVATSLVLAVGLAVAAGIRLAYLGLLVRHRGDRSGAPARATAGALGTRPLVRAYARIAPWLTTLGVVLLTAQENLERASIGGSMPGPGILLTPEYAGGLWVTIAVGLIVSLVAALFEWRRVLLLAKLRRSRPRPPRRTVAVLRRPGVVDRPVESLLGRRSALRAPPAATAS